MPSSRKRGKSGKKCISTRRPRWRENAEPRYRDSAPWKSVMGTAPTAKVYAPMERTQLQIIPAGKSTVKNPRSDSSDTYYRARLAEEKKTKREKLEARDRNPLNTRVARAQHLYKQVEAEHQTKQERDYASFVRGDTTKPPKSTRHLPGELLGKQQMAEEAHFGDR